jgi:undecaprenyl-diphosphatase
LLALISHENINFLAKYCGANGSFPSSHAVNHFAFATYAFVSLRKISSYFWILFIWAAIISISQVYVGVHYPLDIICGAILGFSIGYFISLRFNKHFVLS